MRTRLLMGLLLLVSLAVRAQSAEFLSDLTTSPVLPNGLGVNIHFTNPRPGEMEMLAEGGFRWVRMDFSWAGTEREKGRYDFKAYDQLLASLAPHKIRAVLILDYSNPRYDNGLSPATDAGREAFARWAAAAADHFRGQGVLWEMYNEPNIFFWRPKPDVQQYIKLALAVGKAIHAKAPDEYYVGPATSQLDMEFLEACFKAGLLEYWQAVTVHPYRQNAPETAGTEYDRLRELIRRYAPRGKSIPIISGEWGYSAAWQNYDEVRQGKLLPRQWLSNVANEIPLSIWYDWHDDGKDPKEAEHHFGTVHYPYSPGGNPVYSAKPAYLAARALTHTLDGFSLSKRFDLGAEDDYALLFANGAGDVRLAAWTSSPKPHAVTIPASPGRFKVTAHTGEAIAPAEADRAGLHLTVTDAPQYLAAETPNDLWRIAAAWTRAPLHLDAHAPCSLTFESTVRNPLDRPIRIQMTAGPGVDVQPPGTGEVAPRQQATLRLSRKVARSESSAPVSLGLTIETLGRLVQTSQLAIDNPLRVVPLPAAGTSVAVRLENPSGEPFHGFASLTDVEGLSATAAKTELRLAAGETEKVVSLPLASPAGAKYCYGVRLEEEGRGTQAVPPKRWTAVDDFARYSAPALAAAYHLAPDGDRKVPSEQTMAPASPPAGLPASPASCLKITYRFGEGWKFACLRPSTDSLRKMEGRPRTVGMWVHGDGTGNTLRLRVVDATGQTFQPGGEVMRDKGWRYVTFSLDSSHAGHWGGANDGLVHYPLRWDSLLLIDSTHRKKTEGTVYVSVPSLIE